ncbi:hypothetical protein AAGW05_16980 [Arthrobacter sp. LAPM80]|uniref:hypothetical protein n=1 Tax=Arthrobacter sp. LAPM80 TaxID=3141788 RepID=UPI00398AF9F2
MKKKTIPVIASPLLQAHIAVAAVTTVAGPQNDGTAVTPAGMRGTPAGRQTTLGGLPLNSAISPGGGKLAVTNDGQGPHSLQLVDLGSGNVAMTPVGHRPLSGTVSQDGATAYVTNPGASDESAVDFTGAEPKVVRPIPADLHFVKAMHYQEVL